ncbi:hypothetical protein [Thalassotalea aquiviva]|uniref:hypothetical protein n=1 Tax=Thalassotalea aquiviva TaxID=3242415 RepID=UPI00352A6D46
MFNLKNTSLLLGSALLIACNSVPDAQTAAVVEKVEKPCQKINALINEYQNNFTRLKQSQLETRASQIWKAKYHLVGDACQIWAWGTEHTYSCSVSAPNKEVVDYYFNNAKITTTQCLGTKWQAVEAPRNDGGYKIEFTSPTSDVMLAAHAVPTASLFKSEWTIYYYIGSASNKVN